MNEIVSYEGETGFLAILQALDDLRRGLEVSEITSQQAAGYLGCINVHLAQLIGVRGEYMRQLEECAGLLCPECKGYVGHISDLSGICYHCGQRLFPMHGHPLTAAGGEQAGHRSVHLAHQGVRLGG